MPITQSRMLDLVQVAQRAHETIGAIQGDAWAIIKGLSRGTLDAEAALTMLRDLHGSAQPPMADIQLVTEEAVHFKHVWRANEKRAQHMHTRRYLLSHDEPEIREVALSRSRPRAPDFPTPATRAAVRGDHVNGGPAIPQAPSEDVMKAWVEGRRLAGRPVTDEELREAGFLPPLAVPLADSLSESPPFPQAEPPPVPQAPRNSRLPKAPLLSEIGVVPTGEREGLVTNIRDDILQPPDFSGGLFGPDEG